MQAARWLQYSGAGVVVPTGGMGRSGGTQSGSGGTMVRGMGGGSVTPASRDAVQSRRYRPDWPSRRAPGGELCRPARRQRGRSSQGTTRPGDERLRHGPVGRWRRLVQCDERGRHDPVCRGDLLADRESTRRVTAQCGGVRDVVDPTRHMLGEVHHCEISRSSQISDCNALFHDYYRATPGRLSDRHAPSGATANKCAGWHPHVRRCPRGNRAGYHARVRRTRIVARHRH